MRFANFCFITLACVVGSDTVLAEDFAIRSNGRHSIELLGTNKVASMHREFTAEMICRWTATPGQYRIMGNHVRINGVASGWNVGVMVNADGTSRLSNIFGVSGKMGRNVKPTESQWHHLALTRDPDGGIAVWIDGEPGGNSQFTPAILQEKEQELGNLTIGTSAVPSTPFIGDVRAFKLSSFCRYLNPFDSPTDLEKDDQTIILLDFQRPQANRIMDLSGNGHHGMLAGAQWIDADSGNALQANKMARMSSSVMKRLYGSATHPDANALAKNEVKTRALPGLNTPPANPPRISVTIKGRPTPVPNSNISAGTPTGMAHPLGGRGNPPVNDSRPAMIGSPNSSASRLDNPTTDSRVAAPVVDPAPTKLAVAPPIITTSGAVPQRDQIDAAVETALAIFSKDLKAAETPAMKLALVEKIRTESVPTVGDHVSQIALLEIACRVASEAASVSVAFEIIRAVENYRVDASHLRLNAIERLNKNASRRADKERIASEAVNLASESMTAGNIDIARDSIQIAKSLSSRHFDAKLQKQIARLHQDVVHAVKQSRLAKLAEDRLKTEPDNGIAHLEIGRYQCFVCQNWKLGLPHLNQSSSNVLKTAASLDLACTGEPTGAVKAGDAWWDAAQAVTGVEHQALLNRAAHWYTHAIGSMTGLSKLRIQNRLDQVAALD